MNIPGVRWSSNESCLHPGHRKGDPGGDEGSGSGIAGCDEKSMENIRRYHEKQLKNSWFDTQPDGTILGQNVTALESVGVYVPGGKAAYPSTVLMDIIPAKVAGAERIVMVTPPGKDGKVNSVTLIAAHLAGANEVYKAGGAQAIAALAFGTESIPRVDKIVGPGNIFVALAKKGGVRPCEHRQHRRSQRDPGYRR